MPSASNRPSWRRWYIAEVAMASIGTNAYSPSRRIRSMATWPGGSIRWTATATVSRPTASTTAAIKVAPGPA
ncbi:hypothetical protein [Micromonospora sp. NPDC051296]|uniref:RIFT barrel domain-containing protein n=1 Tax=Micromonospora sp. NPDC051296 TaxID=3155046 RepID=UPI00343CA8CE